MRGARPLWLTVESRGPGVISIGTLGGPLVEFTRGSLKRVGGLSLDRTAAESLLMATQLFPPGPPQGLEWHIASLLVDAGRAIERWGAGGAIWILPAGKSLEGELDTLGHKVELDHDLWRPFREMWSMRTATTTLLNSPGGPSGPWLLNNQWLQSATQEWDFLRQDAVLRTVSSLAGIDGAIVINGDPKLLAFGVICNKFRSPAKEVLEARADGPGVPVTPSTFGGSRHRSAIDFCASCAPAAAIVASHDGGVTVFASKGEGCVTGSRVSLIESSAMATDDDGLPSTSGAA